MGLTDYCWELRLKSAEKLIMLAVARYSENFPDKSACMSIKKISEVTGLDRKTVMLVTDALEYSGYLLVFRPPGGTNIYTIQTTNCNAAKLGDSYGKSLV